MPSKVYPDEASPVAPHGTQRPAEKLQTSFLGWRVGRSDPTSRAVFDSLLPRSAAQDGETQRDESRARGGSFLALKRRFGIWNTFLRSNKPEAEKTTLISAPAELQVEPDARRLQEFAAIAEKSTWCVVSVAWDKADMAGTTARSTSACSHTGVAAELAGTPIGSTGTTLGSTGARSHTHVAAEMVDTSTGSTVTSISFMGTSDVSIHEGDGLRIDEVIPREATAFVVLGELQHYKQSRKLIHQCRAVGRDLPMIAVLLHDDYGGRTDDEVPVLEVQSSGVPELLLICNSVCDWPKAVATSLCAAQESLRISPELPRGLLQKDFGAWEPALLKLSDDTFWLVVHHIFEGFPALNTDVPKVALPGVELGPCRLQELLTQGEFGFVFSTLEPASGRQDVVKAIRKNTLTNMQQVQALRNEIRFSEILRHPGIAWIKHVIHGPNHLFLCMELQCHRTLSDIVKVHRSRPTPRQACKAQAQLVNAVAYCHSKDVAHRKIMPQNIALSDDGSRLRLMCLGSAVLLGEACCEPVGTLPFMALEVMEAAPEVPYDPGMADVWACGVVLLELLGGEGLMQTALGWDASQAPKPSAAYGCMLRALLGDGGGGAAAAFADLAAGAQAWGPRQEFLEVLVGALGIKPQERWTAAELEASAWLQRGWMPTPAVKRGGWPVTPDGSPEDASDLTLEEVA